MCFVGLQFKEKNKKLSIQTLNHIFKPELQSYG